MNDHALTPVQPTRTAGRLFAVAALGSLLFGLVGCTAPESTGNDTTQSAPSAPTPEALSAADAPAGSDTADGTDSANATGTTDSMGNSGATDATGAAAARDVVEQAPAATAAEALAAAQKRFPGEPTQIALDHRRDGTLEYEIDLVSSTEIYEVELDADTLEVFSEEREPLDPGDDDHQEVFDFAQVVDLSKAAATARQAQAGLIHEWSLDGDSDGSVVFEFDIVPSGSSNDIEVRVNALTGELLPRS